MVRSFHIPGFMHQTFKAHPIIKAPTTQITSNDHNLYLLLYLQFLLYHVPSTANLTCKCQCYMIVKKCNLANCPIFLKFGNSFLLNTKDNNILATNTNLHRTKTQTQTCKTDLAISINRNGLTETADPSQQNTMTPS